MSPRPRWIGPMLLMLSACTTDVIPPAPVAVPVQIALLDQGRHAGVAISRPDGSMVHYAYGEWEWFALRNTGFLRALEALFWPTPATLGRRVLPGPLSRDAIARHIGVATEEAFLLTVEAEKVEKLVARLETVFAAHQDQRLYNPAYDLEFVPLPSSYWLGRNSNAVTAEWLEELGCQVDGGVIFSDWAVTPPR